MASAAVASPNLAPGSARARRGGGGGSGDVGTPGGSASAEDTVRTAIGAGNALKLLQALANHGLDLPALNKLALDEEGHLATHWAAAYGQPEVRHAVIVELLLARGMSPTARNLRSETPLHRAVAWGDCYNREVFPRMLYLLRNCLLLTSDNHFTPFLLAATLAVGKQGTRLSGEHYVCVMLSEHLRGALDVGINAQLPGGDTALHLFARADNARVVQLLMLAGADPTILNAKGMLAEQEASPAVAAIIRAGAVQPEVPVGPPPELAVSGSPTAARKRLRPGRREGTEEGISGSPAPPPSKYVTRTGSHVPLSATDAAAAEELASITRALVSDAGRLQSAILRQAWPLWPAARELLATLLGVPQERIHPDLLQSVSAALKEGVTDGAAAAGVSDAPATLLQHARGVIEQAFAAGSAAPSSGSNDNAGAEADTPAADDE